MKGINRNDIESIQKKSFKNRSSSKSPMEMSDNMSSEKRYRRRKAKSFDAKGSLKSKVAANYNDVRTKPYVNQIS